MPDFKSLVNELLTEVERLNNSPVHQPKNIFDHELINNKIGEHNKRAMNFTCFNVNESNSHQTDTRIVVNS